MRLIIDIPQKVYSDIILFGKKIDNAKERQMIHAFEKAIPLAEPYKGMTNGQVHDMLYQMLVDLKDGADRYGAEKWWNSPYQKGGKE